MQEKDLNKEMSQRMLQNLPTDQKGNPEHQKEIQKENKENWPHINVKNNTLDVGVKNNKDTITYDVEIQASNTDGLYKRTRHYQSLIDTLMLDKGKNSCR